VAAEERKRKEERELARQERDRQPVNVVDNSVVTTKTEGIVLQTDLDTSSRKDSLKKVVTQ
jgi:hypothetical protein